MNIRTKLTTLVVFTGLATSGLVGLATPSGAATTGATSTTFTLTAGVLAITAPSSKDLGSVATGAATTSAQLGSVSVSDARGALLGSWTTSVSTTDFVTGGATADETIAKANADYWSGPATATSGVATFTPGQANAGAKQALSTGRTAFSASSVIGNNAESWNPTMIINIPAAAVAGAYTATVTHSVA